MNMNSVYQNTLHSHLTLQQGTKIQSLEQKLQKLEMEKQRAIWSKDERQKEKLEKQMEEIERQIQQLKKQQNEKTQKNVYDDTAKAQAYSQKAYSVGKYIDVYA